VKFVEYKIGDIVDAKVISIKPYGAFLSLSNKETGLLHISQISYDYISDINDLLEVGEIIKVRIIDIDEGKNHIVFSKRSLLKNKRKLKNKHTYHRKQENIMETKLGFSVLKKALYKWIDEYKENSDVEF
jgi:general stress protein 13